REGYLFGGSGLDAISGAGQCHQLHLDAVLFVPSHFGGDGKWRSGGGERAGAETNAELRRLSQDRRARGGDQQARVERAECSFHRAILSRSSRSFSAGSQKRIRRRIRRMQRLSNSPTIDKIRSTENCPETSILKFMLWISMPSPARAPTNSATIAPINAKIIATSSPAITNDRAFGSLSIQKTWLSLAASERMRFIRSSSVDLSPTIVLTSNGKKATRAVLITWDLSPSPNQTTIKGASATLGSDWNITIYG